MAKISRKKHGTPQSVTEFSDPVARSVDEITRPGEEISRPGWDSRALSPEIVEPGKYVWTKPGVKRNKAVKTLAWITAIVVVLINMEFITGDLAKALTEALNIEASVTTQDEAIEITTEDPSGNAESKNDPDGGTPGASDDGSTSASDGGAFASEGTEPGSESTSDPAVATSTAETFEIPDCDMTVFACYSEMMGTLKFTGTKNITKVTLEVWDVLTNTKEESRDITNDIAADGSYSIQPFTTDEIYKRHQAEYDAIMQFPMQVEFKVIVDYKTADGVDQKSWSHVTLMDKNVFYAKFIHEEDRTYFSGPIDILFSTDSTEGESTILFDQPEKAGPNVFSISLTVDGKRIDLSGSKISRSEYDPGVDGSDKHYYADVYLVLPEDFDATAEHEIKLYVSHYLEEYKAVCETVMDIRQ